MSATMHRAETWDRVSHREHCPICDKPDYCKTSPDKAIAGCMRIAEGAFKTKETDLGPMYLHRLTDEPREPRPARPQPAAPPQRNVLADRAVYALVVGTCAPLPAYAADELVRRFGPLGPQIAARQRIGYCDGPALLATIAAAGRRGDAIAAGVLNRDGTVSRSLLGRLVIPYIRDGQVHDLRGAGIKGRGETKELSLAGGYAERGVADLFHNDDALRDGGPDGVFHLAGGAYKTMALVAAGLNAAGLRGEAELSDGHIARLRAAGVRTIIQHIDAEDPQEGQPHSAGRRLGLAKAARLAAAGFTVLMAEPPREPGTPKVDPDALLRDLGPRAVRDYALSAIPLDAWRVVIGEAAPGVPEHAALIARIEAELAEERRRREIEQEEGARMVLRVTELETENAALEAAIKHPDQAASVGALDLVEAANRAYARGNVITQDGKDYARVPSSTTARRRAPKTFSRGFKTLCEAGGLDFTTRTEAIETPTFKGRVAIPYIHIPPELRDRRGAAVLSILPTPTAKKHGGRRTIAIPPEVAAQPHPVKRERELVTRWYDALSNAKLVTERPAPLGTDYWTAQGEQRTAAEIEALRVQSGYQPAPAKPWQPTQPALPIVPDPEPRQDAEVSATPQDERRGEPRQDADINYVSTCRQDAEVFAPPLVEDVPGQCADRDCARRAAIGGYCEAHYGAYSRRYAGAYDDAAGDD